MTLKSMQSIGQVLNANFPMDEEGRTYHVGLKRGEIANVVLLVGDHARASLIKSALDPSSDGLEYHSSRGFLTYTGHYQGVRVSIMSIGMGLAMIDFAVREIRAVVDGPLFLIRLGTCGTPSDAIKLGSIIAADKSFAVTTNFDAYQENSQLPKFVFSAPVAADAKMHAVLFKNLRELVQDYAVLEATDATADSFYSSQGRVDPRFSDGNEELLEQILSQYPLTASLQMETFLLYHLSRLGQNIRAAAATIVLAQRRLDTFLSKDVLHTLEMSAGRACLKTLVEFANQ